MLNRLYKELPSVDFSRDVLSHQVQLPALVASPPCGWTDLGTPSQVAATVEATRHARRCSGGVRMYLDLALSAGGGA